MVSVLPKRFVNTTKSIRESARRTKDIINPAVQDAEPEAGVAAPDEQGAAPLPAGPVSPRIYALGLAPVPHSEDMQLRGFIAGPNGQAAIGLHFTGAVTVDEFVTQLQNMVAHLRTVPEMANDPA